MTSRPHDLNIDADEMRRIGYRVIDAIVDRFSNVATYPAARVASGRELEERIAGPLPEDGRSIDELLRVVVDDVMPYSVTLGHPRFFGFIPGPGNFISSMADALAAGFNPFVGTWLGGSGPAALELTVLDWLRDLCGLPEGAGGLLTSGGSLANLTAIAAARHRARTIGARMVYLCDQTHYSNERGLRTVGYTAEETRIVPADGRYAMDTFALRAHMEEDIAAGLLPALVIATAGSTNVGAVDDLPAIADLCRTHGAWLHVDGAYGAAVTLSPKLRASVAGIERADSVTLDPHKWFFQPFEIGCVLVRDTSLLRDTFRITPDYLQDVHRIQEVNFTDYGLQLTRSFRALKLWMSFQYYGAARIRRAVEHGVALAEYAQTALEKRDGWEVLSPAQLAIVAFRWRPERSTDTATCNQLNDAIALAAREDGFLFLSTTTLGGRIALRFCTINPATTQADIDASIARLETIATRL